MFRYFWSWPTSTTCCRILFSHKMMLAFGLFHLFLQFDFFYPLFFHSKFYLSCVCVCVCVHLHAHTLHVHTFESGHVCRDHRTTFWNPFSPSSFRWFLRDPTHGIGLFSSAFPLLNCLTNANFHFFNVYLDLELVTWCSLEGLKGKLNECNN